MSIPGAENTGDCSTDRRDSQNLKMPWSWSRLRARLPFFLHRFGELAITESSVVIVITSPHRRVAFEACHFAIDRLKQTVPIWKKEIFEDGEEWVEGGRPGA